MKAAKRFAWSLVLIHLICIGAASGLPVPQSSCALAIAPLNQIFPATGGTGSITITADTAQCQWTARSNAAWIRLTSQPSGTGNGIVTFSVEPTVGSRSGTVVVAGNTFTIFQEFFACGQVTNLFATSPQIQMAGNSFAGPFPQIAVNDFNRDGKLDAVFYTRSPRVLSISLSNATGGYNPSASILQVNSGRSIRTADFNKDGNADLVTTVDGNGIAVLLGKGDGTFQPPLEIKTSPAAPNPFYIAAGDLTDDGKLDLAVTTNARAADPTTADQNISIFPGDGNGGFAQAIFVGIHAPGDALIQIEAGDFNGDGKTDLVAMSVTGELFLLTGKGAGMFDPAVKTAPRTGYPWMAVGDFNGDRKSDVAIFGSDDAEAKIFLAGGGNLLQSPFSQPLLTQPGAVVAEDFNGDGKTDLAVAHPDGLAVYPAIIGGRFDAPIYYFTGAVEITSSNYNLSTLATGDFNRDGRPDVFLPSNTALTAPNSLPLVVVSPMSAEAAAMPRSFSFSPNSNQQPGRPTSATIAADLNGDGLTDLVTAVSDGISVLFGTGRGELREPLFFPTGQPPGALFAADFNNDHRLDLVSVNSDAQVRVLFNDGHGGFSTIVPINNGPNPRTVATGDFNGDGNADLIVSGRNDILSLFVGNGLGGFTEMAAGIGDEFSDPIFVTGDFNGDGNLDLAMTAYIAGSCFSNKVSILAGDGKGRFSRIATVPLTVSPANLVAEDFNGDGRTDLAFVNNNCQGRTVYVMLATSAGLAQPVAYPYIASIFGTSLSIGDLNGDAKSDLILSGSVLFNTGNGTFGAPQRFTAGRNPLALPVADFNQDGVNDLAIFQGTTSTFSVLLNNAACPPPASVVATSAASFAHSQSASDAIAALFGVNLSASTQIADTLPLPTSLGGVSIKLKDSAGVERFSPLFFTSPSQINHLIPSGTAAGAAIVTVTNGSNVVATGTLMIAATSPGLFTADASGQGIAAAVVLRVKPDGSQLYEPIARFDAAQNRIVAVPIDLSNASDQVFLLLFGTGIRNRSSLAAVSAKVGGDVVETLYAGEQGGYEGLDQINLRLLKSLAGRGDADVVLDVDGKMANTVRVFFK